MPLVSAFTTLFGQFLCGLVLLPLILYFVLDSPDPATFVRDALTSWQSKDARDLLLPLTPAIIIFGYFIGLLIDSLGHCLDAAIFDFIWNRKHCIPATVKNLIYTLSRPHLDTPRLDIITQSIFYTHCSGHTLAYRSEQWSYYEFFRNVFTLIAMYTIAIVWMNVHFGYPTILVIFALGAALALLIFAMGWTATYYYRLEAYAALGWLYTKRLERIKKT